MKIKGTAVKSTFAYISSRLDDRLYSFLEMLTPEVSKFFTSTLSLSDFYEVDKVVQIMEKAAIFLGQDPRTFYYEVGKASADYGLKTVYRIFMKLGSPEYIIKKSPLVWRSYYNEGTMIVENASSVGVTLAVTGASFPHHAICDRITGWMERTLEISGAKRARVDHTECTLEGDVREAWQGHWDI